MSMRYKGGVISATPPTISTTSAPGIWTLQQQFQNAGIWPQQPPPTDEFFEYVSMLLPGNGTNGAQNNTFLDSSTNAFSITRNGNTTQGTFSPYGNLWSNYFDTSGDYLFFNNAGLAVTTQDFTAEAWVYLASTPGPNEANVLWNQAQSQSNASQTSWQLLINTDRTVVAAFFSGSTRNAVTTSATIPLGVWTHVAIIRNGSTYSVALNGTLTSSNFGSLTLNSQNYVYIGNALGDNNPQYQLNGYISSARYVRGSAVYTSNFTPPTAPLTAITNTALLTCQSNRFIDNSTNGYAITRTGDVSVQRFSPFNPTASYSTSTIGGSGYFDGSGDYLSFGAQSAFNCGTSNDFCMEAWAYRTAANDSMHLWTAHSAGTADGFYFTTASSGGFYPALSVYSGGGGGGGVVSNKLMPQYAWTHIVVTRQSGRLRLFLNGELTGTTTTSYQVNTDGRAVTIGGGVNFSGDAGYISQSRYINGSVPTSYQTSATALGTQVFTPPTAPLSTTSQGATAGDVKGLVLYANAGIIDNSMMNNLETVGNAQISTAQSKFGGSSLYFDGSGDDLRVVNAGVTTGFGTGAFTVEFWVYANSWSSFNNLVDFRKATDYFMIAYTSGAIQFYNNGSYRINGGSLSTATWYHVAVCRSGTSTKMFVDGTQVGSTYTDSTNYPVETVITIGARNDDIGNPFNGYIDDLRITKGYARYTANFTPPTAPFPTF